FRTHQVFAKEGFKRFKQRAQAHRVGKIQSRVIVNAPSGVRAYGFADGHGIGVRLAYHLLRDEGRVIAGIGYRGAKSAKACRDGRTRRLFQTTLIRDEASRVTFAVLARAAAEQLPDGHAERLAFDVPQRHIQRTHRIELLASSRVKAPAK